MNIYEQIQRNKTATWIFLCFFVLLFLALGAGADYLYVGFPFYAPVAFGAALVSSLSSYFYGDKLVLGSTNAVPLDTADPRQQQWQNVIEEMSIASGIPLPKTYFIDDDDPNALATGRDPRHASIAVTRGLLNALSREELQAVAAHEMSHIRNYDIRLMLIVAVLAGSIALLADWTGRMLFRRGRRNGNGKSEGQMAIVVLSVWIVAVVLAPIIARLVALCVSRRREYLADASGAELTRNPLALASALEKISAHAHPTASIHRGTAHLCIEDPAGRDMKLKEGWLSGLFSSHPPVAKRVERLKGMAYSSTMRNQ